MLNNQTVKANSQVSHSDTFPNLYLGLIAASVAPAFFFIVIFWLLLIFIPIKGPTESFSSATAILVLTISIFIIAFLIALFHVLLLGAPLALIASHYKSIRWWVCLPAGFILGFIPATTIATINRSDITSFWVIGLFMGLHGLIGGLAFWLVWRSSSETRNKIELS